MNNGSTLLSIAFGISIQSEHQRQCRSRCEGILNFILSADFRTGRWEPLYRFMDRKRLLGHYRYYLEKTALYAAHESMVGEGIPTFYESVRETALYMVNFPYCTGIDKDSVSKKRNELANLGLIGKSANLDHPAFAKAKEYQEKLGNLHHKEFLFLPDLTEEILEFALQEIGKAKNKGERARFKTRAALITSRDDDVAADRIFKQDAGKGINKFQKGFIYKMWRTASHLTCKGWTTEDEIAEEIIRTSKFPGVKWRLGQFRPLLTNGDLFTLQVVNNELRNKLKLPETIPTRKKIIVPTRQVDMEDVLNKIFGDVS